MDLVALVLAAAVALAAVAVVARPLLRSGADVGIAEPGERLPLLEARDRALAALKELELDHRTGKVSDEDYRAAVGPLRREVAEALRALDPPEAPVVTAPERVSDRG